MGFIGTGSLAYKIENRNETQNADGGIILILLAKNPKRVTLVPTRSLSIRTGTSLNSDGH